MLAPRHLSRTTKALPANLNNTSASTPSGPCGAGEDEFTTKKTGYAGSNNLRVGFRAPGLVYYESDYTEVIIIYLFFITDG